MRQANNPRHCRNVPVTNLSETWSRPELSEAGQTGRPRSKDRGFFIWSSRECPGRSRLCWRSVSPALTERRQSMTSGSQCADVARSAATPAPPVSGRCVGRGGSNRYRRTSSGLQSRHRSAHSREPYCGRPSLQRNRQGLPPAKYLLEWQWRRERGQRQCSRPPITIRTMIG
jgi:hypothetical protein